MNLSNKGFRKIARALHILLGIALILHFYTPLSQIKAFTLFISVFAIPIVSLTGIGLWQQPKIIAFLKGRKSA